jgi:hypothetical protein
VWREGELLRGREDSGTQTVLSDALELTTLLRKLSGGVRLPLVMDITDSKSVSREARAHLAGDVMADTVTVVALVVGSALARALGSFWLTFSRPRFTVKLFTSTEDAKAWAMAQPR